MIAPEKEAWLKILSCANSTKAKANSSKAKIRNVMSAVWNHGIRNRLVPDNPIIGSAKGGGVRQSAERRKSPDVLTSEEVNKLLAELREPFRTMGYLLASTGLRFSELRGLQWADHEVKVLKLKLRRGVVGHDIGPMKNSPAGSLSQLLRPSLKCSPRFVSDLPTKADTDWIFASVKKNGEIPIWGNSAPVKHIQPAVKRAGILKQVSWHVFRHSFSTLLNANGEDVKTVQESLRHSTSAMSMDVYTQAIPEALRNAQERITSSFRGETKETLGGRSRIRTCDLHQCEGG